MVLIGVIHISVDLIGVVLVVVVLVHVDVIGEGDGFVGIAIFGQLVKLL